MCAAHYCIDIKHFECVQLTVLRINALDLLFNAISLHVVAVVVVDTIVAALLFIISTHR